MDRIKIGKRELLYRSDGTRIPEQELLEEYGIINLRILKMMDAIYCIQKRQISLPYPPSVFISYKIGSKNQNLWVSKLAEGIKSNGFNVVCDRLLEHKENYDFESMVAQIIECSLFIPVLTNSYADHVLSGSTSYVFDEINLALVSQESGTIEIIPVLSETVNRFPWHADIFNFCIVDLRDNDNFDKNLSKYFSYTGPTLNDSQKTFVFQTFENALQIKSYGNIDESIKLLTSIVNVFPFIHDVWFQLTKICYEHANYKQALIYAQYGLENILPHILSKDIIVLKALILMEIGQIDEAVKLLIKVIKEGKRKENIRNAHHVLGNILDDKGDYITARNHLSAALNILTTVVAKNDLGIIYMHLGYWEKALKLFKEIIKIEPTFELAILNIIDTLVASKKYDECYIYCQEILNSKVSKDTFDKVQSFFQNIDHKFNKNLITSSITIAETIKNNIFTWFFCKKCHSIFPINFDKDKICGSCGAIILKEKEECSHCKNDGSVPIEMYNISGFLIGCPICRKGSLQVTHEMEL